MSEPRLPSPDPANVLEKTWAALLSLDHECRITWTNPAAERLAGAAHEALRGRRFCEVFLALSCDDDHAESCPFSRALQGRERRATPRWLTATVGGRSLSLLVSAASTKLAPPGRGPERSASGAVVTMVPSLLVDEADRRRRELIASALHELRHTASIQTMAVDLLSGSEGLDLPEQVRPLFDTLRHTAALLTISLDDLLNRTLFDLDAIPLQPRDIEVFPLLQGVVARLSPVLSKRSQSANLTVPHDLHAWIDPTAIEHVVVNLLLNAHKYSVDGDVIVLAARQVPGERLVEISVRDHGPGIAPAERRRVFDRYYRAARTRTRPGVGLGLAIVRTLVEQLGGSVGVRAPRGGGALVWVRLPMPAPEGAGAGHLPA